MKTLEIKYQTSGLVPAPYAFAVELNLEINGDKINYTYDLQFIDREGISEEELEEEGFSEHDNLNLKGKLGKEWAEAIVKIQEKTKPVYLNELKEEQAFWEIKTSSEKIYPTNSTEWEQLLEEFKQAILEAHKIEAPLQIKILRIGEGETQEFNIKGEFECRKLEITKPETSKILPWNNLSRVLKDYFGGELLPDKTSEKTPQKTGLFIDYGDGHWYQLGYSLLTKPSKITSWLE
jgi:hypothetical protein